MFTSQYELSASLKDDTILIVFRISTTALERKENGKQMVKLCPSNTYET